MDGSIIGTLTGFGSIIVICYCLGAALKSWKKITNNDIIPVCCAVFGGLLGIAAFYLKIPEFPAQDILSAIAVGIISGFTATGIKEFSKLFYAKSE